MRLTESRCVGKCTSDAGGYGIDLGPKCGGRRNEEAMMYVSVHFLADMMRAQHCQNRSVRELNGTAKMMRRN
jgi:hypothetical protein